jgi:hypothetical protein
MVAGVGEAKDFGRAWVTEVRIKKSSKKSTRGDPKSEGVKRERSDRGDLKTKPMLDIATRET